jgi:hypothetical protein
MTTYIEQVVSEVTPEPETTETSESGESPDPRWGEQEKFEAMGARCERLAERVRAEGFDD